MTPVETAHVKLAWRQVHTKPAESPPVTGQSVRIRRLHGVARAAGAGFAVGLIITCSILLYGSELRELALRAVYVAGVESNGDRTPSTEEAETRQAAQRVSRLRTRLRSALPKTAYLVVSTSENRFELFGRGGLVREGVCSTGSYVLLRGGNDQEWMFQTPRGAFRILEKRVNPVWSKPDWAFVEEGLPVPAPGSPERYERGVLGRYALGIGNGYLIHGTLYQRMLGQPVTHGCIRLGDDDLEAVYRQLALGGRVFIY